MRRFISLAAVAAVGLWLAGAALAQNQRRAADQSADKLGADGDFVQKVASGGQLEVRLGELAQSKGANVAVRRFGARMVRDHTKANMQLAAALTGAGITPPRVLLDKDIKTFNELAKLSGAEFDRAYMKHMVEDHKEDVALFEKEAKDGKDAKIKAFAEKALPTLKEHLKLAEETYEKVQGKKDKKP
jgi:putative membrane protein